MSALDSPGVGGAGLVASAEEFVEFAEVMFPRLRRTAFCCVVTGIPRRTWRRRRWRRCSWPGGRSGGRTGCTLRQPHLGEFIPGAPAPQADGRASPARPVSEPEASQAAWLRRQGHDRRAWLNAIHVPRWWSLRRCVERGSDARPAVVKFGRPAVVRPRLRNTCHRTRLGHSRRVTLDDDVRVADRHRDRTPPIARDIASLPRARAGCRRSCRPGPGMRSRGVRTRRPGGALGGWRRPCRCRRA